MPRELSDERCEMEFEDRISNSTITLHYDPPTTEDRISYANEQIVRKGNKVENKTGETRLKWGLKKLTGFNDGDFVVKGQPISWDPQSPNYNAAWKTIVKKYASDIVAALAMIIFEMSVSATPPEPAETDDEEHDRGDDAASCPRQEEAEGKDEHPLQQT